MKIIPLGINGFFPSFGRHTTSFLVLTADDAIVLDAGTGMARLFERRISELLAPYKQLHVILSHYHLDHVVGLAYLAGASAERSLVIHAPAPPLVESDPFNALHSLLKPPFFSLPLAQFPMEVRVEPVTGSQFVAGQSLVSVRPQIHPGGSVGVRLDDLVFMTDTAVDDRALTFMSGAKLLLHEVWLRDQDVAGHSNELSGHSFESGVVKLANKADVRQMMPIHVHPQRSDEDLRELVVGMERQGVQIARPVEGQVLEIV